MGWWDGDFGKLFGVQIQPGSRVKVMGNICSVVNIEWVYERVRKNEEKVQTPPKKTKINRLFEKKMNCFTLLLKKKIEILSLSVCGLHVVAQARIHNSKSSIRMFKN